MKICISGGPTSEYFRDDNDNKILQKDMISLLNNMGYETQKKCDKDTNIILIPDGAKQPSASTMKTASPTIKVMKWSELKALSGKKITVGKTINKTQSKNVGKPLGKT